MSGPFFTHRHSMQRDGTGGIELDEHFYLNQDSYAAALGEVLHCFAFGVSYWGENCRIRKECGSYLSFNFFLEGDAIIHYERNRITARPGDLLVAQFRHGFGVRTGPAGKVRKLCLLLTCTPLQAQICRMLFPEDLRLIRLPAPDRVRQILEDIYHKIREDDKPDRRMELTQLLFHFLLEVQRQVEQNRYPEALATAIRVAATAGARRLSREELAAAAGTSVSTLTRLFRHHLDCSPGQYLIRSRLERAAGMLMLTRSNIKTVAYECGFNSPMFFARSFKQHYGMTPGEFKRGRRSGDALLPEGMRQDNPPET